MNADLSTSLLKPFTSVASRLISLPGLTKSEKDSLPQLSMAATWTGRIGKSNPVVSRPKNTTGGPDWGIFFLPICEIVFSFSTPQPERLRWPKITSSLSSSNCSARPTPTTYSNVLRSCAELRYVVRMRYVCQPGQPSFYLRHRIFRPVKKNICGRENLDIL